MMNSFSSVRVSGLYNESGFLNETEQDANSVLTELDKGLRSSKLGVQCEAIVRFPRLFEKYPFPILINSSFLKLAEFFWTGSNLLRFWVLRVCQQSENHLDKILNIDAFVKRIYMVMHANDPMARALTLRTLGSVSRVIPEKQQVHHAIRRALDSHDTMEVEAAIFASGQFASQSRTFAISMCAKISDMIESLKIPLPMKLQLIPVLRHMHHDANTAALVKALCRKLLPKYPAESFVIAILDSLTQLSAKTLTDIPYQIHLLLDSLDDQRAPVRCQALKSLTTLADEQCVHAWPRTALGNLIRKALSHTDSREQFLFLRLILRLCNCPLTCHTLLKEEQSAIVQLCMNCLVGMEDYEIASQAMAIISSLVVYAYQDFGSRKIIVVDYKLKNLLNLIKCHMESLLICIICMQDLHVASLRRLLRSGINISRVNSDFGHFFVNYLCDLLSDDSLDIPCAHESLVCETLAAVCSHFQLNKFSVIPLPEPKDEQNANFNEESTHDKNFNPIMAHLPLFLHKLDLLILENDTEPNLMEIDNNMDNNTIINLNENELRVLESLMSVIILGLLGCFMPTNVAECILSCATRLNDWTRFRMARTAARYGQHYLAAQLYSEISLNVSVDKMRFYLSALAQMEQAECVLNHSLTYKDMQLYYPTCAKRANNASIINVDNLNVADENGVPHMPLTLRLTTAVHLYRQALASMRASSSPQHAFTFQEEFLKLRAQFLQALHTAVTIKNAHVTVPPPAIASSLAQTSRDYLQKFGHITNQLRKLVKLLKSCGDNYASLYKSAFDADPATLEFLEIAEYQCALVAHVVECICYATPPDAPTFLPRGTYPETRCFVANCRRMEQLAALMPQEANNSKTIDNCHLNIITAQIELITRTPLCIPRYFYQQLQSTAIKLSVSPQPRNPGDPVLVQSGSNLVIKVEGVISHFGRKQEHFRHVESVQLVLTQTAIPTRNSNMSSYNDNGISNNKIIINESSVTLTQTVKPQREFLCGNFLLPISSGGQWQVSLETYVIDELGNSWCTGPKSSMVVRVLEDPSKTSSSSSSNHGVHSRHRYT